MKTDTDRDVEVKLAESTTGRVLLHLACLCRDRHVRWHLAGIKRELLS